MKNSKLIYLSACVLTLPSMALAKQKPNIIIIYADDVGIGDLACYGTGNVPTPNVDRLAQEGILFTNSHATSAVSTPSRFGLLTGVYPWRQAGTGIAPGDAGMIIRPERYTIADAAHQAGYVTGAVGKWHLGLGESSKQDWNGTISPALTDIGFDYSYIMAATGDRVPCVFIENAQVANWDATAPIEVSYSTPFPGEPTGKKNPELLRVHPSHGHDQAIVNGVSRIGYMKGGGKALWRDEDIADRITQKAVSFIEKNAEKPFFLYFATNDVHVPRLPHERFLGKSGLGVRGDAILEFDYSVGQIMKTLDRLGLAENTLLILSSDNGPVVDDGYQDLAVELLGTHRPWGIYRGGKYSAFEAGTRVPMIVRWSGVTPQNHRSDALFSHVDFLESLSSLMGVKTPSKAHADSRNALPVLLGKEQKGRAYAIEQNQSNTICVLLDQWKFICASDGIVFKKTTQTEMGNAPENRIFDLRVDPGERTNVLAQHPEVVTKVQNILTKEFKKEVAIPIPSIVSSH